MNDANAQACLSVEVRFMGDLAALTGQRSTQVTLPEGSTVGDLMASLAQTYGEAFAKRVFSGPARLHHYVLLFLNGENVKQRDGLATRLTSGKAEIVMLPMFGGG